MRSYPAIAGDFEGIDSRSGAIVHVLLPAEPAPAFLAEKIRA